ncbi:RagB/SusD family nutrient uptake outer membrane protein [Alistipes sp. OttesenSCG-928-B03]|nr:RagB/SusD family nutrient uptake outer membrane protein [Alistipes sp. OttesenSCG-928-B03]
MKYKILTLAAAAIIGFSSCEWLNVTPASQIEVKEFLKEESGFRNALTGLYIKMKEEGLYGQTLTMTTLEFLAQHWDYSTGTYFHHLSTFDYRAADVELHFTEIFRNFYFVIAEANLILQYIDDYEHVFEDPRVYKLIKGEVLGIRAWCHFEILRLWGPVPGSGVNRMLAYNTKVSKDRGEYIPCKAFVLKLHEDLAEAEKLLEEVDPIRLASLDESYNGGVAGYRDAYWNRRNTKLNYFAVCGLRARLYLWDQDKPNALLYARRVIDAVDGNAAPIFQLASQMEFESGNNNILWMENIFSMDDHELSMTNQTLTSSSDGISKDEVMVKTVYAPTDLRLTKLWGNAHVPGGKSRFTTMKYMQTEEMKSVAQSKMPLMRLPEMYFIAMECGDPSSADLYADFCTTRSITPAVFNEGTVSEILRGEYNREFYAEGQMFYYYKRTNDPRMEWEQPSDINRNDVYMPPLPRGEALTTTN